MGKKVFVLGIDGVPYSLLMKFMKQKRFVNLESVIDPANIKEIKSVYPVISSVAWTSFATGVNPAEHGIFGFVDRNSSPFEIMLPTSRERKADAIWNTLSKHGKQVVIMNVPITYPVEPVNGKMISCFLCPDIYKGAYPESIVSLLEKHNYIIDVDAWLARSDKERFLEELFMALDARFEVALELLKEEWDYFQLHIMETDRLMHFFWCDIEKRDSPYYEKIVAFIKKLDNWIGKLCEKLDKDTAVIILSDHGFCGIKYEVQINAWLKQKKYLIMRDESYNLNDFDEKTICYSLLPGRIFINLKGREEHGCVDIKDYNRVRQEIKEQLLKLENPDNGEKVIDKVFFREEIYTGDELEKAADIIAHPNNGYDLKGMLNNDLVFTNSALTGMHTYENAVIAGRGFSVSRINSIIDVRNEILQFYGI